MNNVQELPGITVTASRKKQEGKTGEHYQFDGGDPEGLTVVIHHKKTDEYFIPSVLDGATWEIHRKGSPGRFQFSITRDDVLKVEEGDTVDATWQGTQFFHGFVFTRTRTKDKTFQVMAYDQLRYFLNKDTFSYTGKKASEVIKELTEDFECVTGDMDDTAFVIDKRREANATILDMAQNALDLTMIHTNKIFVLYDDCGKITVKDIEKLQTDLLIDADTAQDYEYKTTIDKGTYNLVKLVVDDQENGQKAYYAPHTAEEYAKSETRKQWGVLQLFESINPKSQSPQALADTYLSHYNRLSRSLRIKGAAGNIHVRGGSMMYINIDLGENDETGQGKEQEKKVRTIIVESVTHRFENRLHTMDLEVRGDIITGEGGEK